MQRRVWVGLVAIVLPSCGGWPTPVTSTAVDLTRPTITMPHEHRVGIAPATTAAALRALLVGRVANAGVWFEDPTCAQTFEAGGLVEPERFDVFARCLAALNLRPSGRDDGNDDTSVLADDHGFELEVRVRPGDHPTLDYVGFSARVRDAPDLPTITPATLEALRTGGDAHPRIASTTAKVRAGARHVRVCLDASGATRSTTPVEALEVDESRAIVALAATWTFAPFSPNGAPIAVCAILPLDPVEHDHVPRVSDTVSKSGKHRYFLPAGELGHPKTRVGVSPDRETWRRATRDGKSTLLVAFYTCLDEGGRVEDLRITRSSGYERFDLAVAASKVDEWVYEPFLVDGVAVPVCASTAYAYTQR